MHIRLIFCVVVILITSSCKDVNAPQTSAMKHSLQPKSFAMELNDREETLFMQLTQGMSAETAAKMRERLLDRHSVVLGNNDRERELIAAIYASLKARYATRPGSKPAGPGPRTDRNSWKPNADDWTLINKLLAQVPPERRETLLDDLLRTDVWLTNKANHEIQQLLDQIYTRRRLRMKESLDSNSR
jgi:hypothetical protein